MKKEAIITIIIILLILAGEWTTQNYTNKKLSKLQFLLENSDNENKKEIKEIIKEVVPTYKGVK